MGLSFVCHFQSFPLCLFFIFRQFWFDYVHWTGKPQLNPTLLWCYEVNSDYCHLSVHYAVWVRIFGGEFIGKERIWRKKRKGEMASLGDIAVAGVINLLIAFVFLIAFALLRLQPMNDKVYFPKWYLKGSKQSPKYWRSTVGRFVNLDYKTYMRFLSWMPEALKMPEPELIDHVGLDAVVYLRIYILG